MPLGSGLDLDRDGLRQAQTHTVASRVFRFLHKKTNCLLLWNNNTHLIIPDCQDSNLESFLATEMNSAYNAILIPRFYSKEIDLQCSCFDDFV